MLSLGDLFRYAQEAWWVGRVEGWEGGGLGGDEKERLAAKARGLSPKTPDWGKATLKYCFQKMLGAHRQWVRDGGG